MRFAVAVGALQPGRHHQPGAFPPARLHPVNFAAVVAGAGEPGVLLEVFERGVVGLLQDLLDPFLPHAPQRLPFGVSGQPRPAGLFAERGVQHRHRLVVRHRQIGVQRRPPRLLPRFAFQLQPTFPGSVRLSGQLGGENLAEPPVPVRRPAKLLTRVRVGLLVGGQVRVAFHELPVGEPEGFGAVAEPPARRLPLLSGVEVVPACGLLPRPAQVVLKIKPGPGGHHRHRERTSSRLSDHDQLGH